MSGHPKNICLMRLSAIGDVCHTVAVVQNIQRTWPHTKITWIIGKTEAALLQGLPGVEFIIFNKIKLASFYQIHQILKKRIFDILLHMQLSMRANLLSVLIRAKIRIGFDCQRSKELHSLFINQHIQYQPRQHVLESFFGFSEAMGIITPSSPTWYIPVPGEAKKRAASIIPPKANRTLIIAPCASFSHRNWTVKGYSILADYAYQAHGMQVLLCGGPTAYEKNFGSRIYNACQHPILNLIGKTDLKLLLALFQRADVLMAPDSGPAQLATAAGIPVIGLYAATDPDRARPYLSKAYVVSEYKQAVRNFYGTTQVPWGARVKEGAMQLIRPDVVINMLNKVMRDLGFSEKILA